MKNEVAKKVNVEQKQVDELCGDSASKLETAKDELKNKFWEADIARVKAEISSLEARLELITKPFDDKMKAVTEEYSKRINQARLSLLVLHKPSADESLPNQNACKEETKTQVAR